MKYRKIFALLLAAATLFSLAACGETAAGPETTPDPALDESAATVSGQTLTFAGAADDVFSLSLDYEESLNPVKTQSTLNQLVDCLVYDRLFEVDENFNVTSRILSDWYYSKNEDSAGVWVLKVREGIQMHDGSTLTAQDVAYSVSCIFTSERHKHLQQQIQQGTVNLLLLLLQHSMEYQCQVKYRKALMRVSYRQYHKLLPSFLL